MAEPKGGWARTWLPAVAVVLGLVLAGWGADTFARTAAEGLVARDVQAATGASEKPTVNISGRFFLLQLVRGAYHQVHIRAHGLNDGPLTISQVDAELSDTRVPFRDVLLHDVRTIGIAHSEETVRLSYPAVNAYLAATGRSLKISAAAGGQNVTVSGTVAVLGQHLTTTAEVRLTVVDGNLRLTPYNVTSSNKQLGATARLLLTQRLTLTVPLSGLPFSQRLTAARADNDGLVIQAVGDAVMLQP